MKRDGVLGRVVPEGLSVESVQMMKRKNIFGRTLHTEGIQVQRS